MYPGAIDKLELDKIINVKDLQLLMDDLYNLTHIGGAIVDRNGRVLVSTGWQEICTRFHRVHPETKQHCMESDVQLTSDITPGTWKLYKCKNNMWDMATPIVIADQHVGNLFLGQFFFDDEEVDRDFFKEQAKRYGFVEADYLAALDKVPRWSRESVESAFRAYARLATMISDLSYTNLRLTQALDREQANEKNYYKLAEYLPNMFFELDTQGQLVHVNRSAFEKWQYTPEDLRQGLTAVNLFIKEDQPRLLQNLQRLLKGEAPGPSEYMAVRKDGTTFPVIIHSAPIIREETIYGIRGIMLDLSRQHEEREKERIAQEALKASEAKLQAILDSSPDIILEVDCDMHVIWANKASCDAVDNLEGKTCYKAFIGRDVPCEECPCKRALETGQIQRATMHHGVVKGVSGSESYWDTIGVPLKDSQGKTTSVIEISRNITEIKRSEKRLARVNKCLLELGSDFDENVNKITLLCGELFGATCALYNRLQGGMLCSLGQWHTPEDYQSEDAPEGHICFDIIKMAQDRPIVIRNLQETDYMQTDPNVAAYQLRTYIGQVVRCGNEPVGSFCMVFQDDVAPTEEDKWLLGILASALGKEEEQQKAEEAYRRIYQVSSDLICVADMNTNKFLQVNPAFEHALGYTKEELLSRSFLEFVHPADVAKTRAVVEEELKKGNDVISFENRYRCKDGSCRVLEWNSHPNPVDGVSYDVAHDVTEQKQFEEQLEQARDAAESANRAKSTFLANMSHELRTPLNPVIGFTEMLLEEAELSDDHRECLELVHQRSQDLLHLLNDILDIARIEADHMTVTPQPIDLHSLMAEVVLLYDVTLSQKGVTLKTSIADSVPEKVCLDPLRLRQILMNLIGNAVKFTEKGSIEVAAWVDYPNGENVHSDAMPAMLYVKVQDSGVGIPQTLQHTIFESFEQGDATYTRKHSGVGLGLSICKRLIDMMGGNIGVHSEPGKGAVFSFSLPLQSLPVPATVSDDSSAVRPALSDQLQILLVEDDFESRLLAERILKNAGGSVHSVSDGQQAVDACRKNRYDIIVMDVKMPIMDGLTATRLIRKYEEAQNIHTPILAMTAFAFEEDRQACLAAGMDDYVTKPLMSAVFLEKLVQLQASADVGRCSAPSRAVPRRPAVDQGG